MVEVIRSIALFPKHNNSYLKKQSYGIPHTSSWDGENSKQTKQTNDYSHSKKSVFACELSPF